MISTGERTEELLGRCYSLLNKENCSIFKSTIVGMAVFIFGGAVNFTTCINVVIVLKLISTVIYNLPSDNHIVTS